MLHTLLQTTIRIDRLLEGQPPKLEGVLIEEDAEKPIWIYEGQLKEIPVPVEPGKTYRATFLPFVNNRWVELKLIAVEELSPSECGD